MNESKTNPAASRPASGWTWRRWLTLVTLVFAAQVLLIFALGKKQTPATRTVPNVPHLALADATNDLIALSDPTLFALPRAADLAPAVWGQMPVAMPPSFPRAEPVLPSLLSAETLGATFIQFMRTNIIVPEPQDFKVPPRLSEPRFLVEPALPENSTLEITGDLAQRPLLRKLNLPTLPANDVIAPSRVQIVVNPAGSVVSWALMPSANRLEADGRAEVGDTNALQIARTLRFMPATHLSIGLLIFHWRTVALPTTSPTPDGR